MKKFEADVGYSNGSRKRFEGEAEKFTDFMRDLAEKLDAEQEMRSRWSYYFTAATDVITLPVYYATNVTCQTVTIPVTCCRWTA